MNNSDFKVPIPQKILLGAVLLIVIIASWLAVLWSISGTMSTISVEKGQVASQDYMAPNAVNYVSEVLTEEKREEAAAQVDPVYTASDPEIARTQLKRLTETLAFIDSVREDEYASQEQQLSDLSALESIHLNQDTALQILELSDTRWETVKQEAVAVLEQVMRNPITSSELEETRQNIPSLVSLSLSEEQVTLVSKLTSAFVVPNSFYSEERTEEAREQARSEVAPQRRSIAEGETIVRRGEIIQEEDIEALQQVGLLSLDTNWQNTLGSLAIVLLSTAFVVLFFRAYPTLLQKTKKMLILGALFLFFLVVARLLNPGHVVLPYLFPLAAYPLIVSTLISRRAALFTTIPLAILAAYGMPHSLDLMLYYSLSGVMGVLILRKPQRLSAYLSVGAIVAAAGAVVVISYRVTDSGTDVLGLVTLVLASVFQGAASAGLTVLLEYFLAPVLDLTTTMQLMELSRPDHPLLQRLLREVPGTYQHTLQVANLAEQAAEQINAESFLTRVGALYHDIGKMKSPKFFVENQAGKDLDTHDEMDPERSASQIIEHVTYGLELARKYNLPKRIRDFIPEHHGTLVASYQYSQAVQEAGGDESKVDISQFRYPGPKPQSAETALVMLADGCEAYARSKNPDEEEELRALVKEMVDKRVKSGQLDDTPLTLRDLSTIVDSFVATMKGTYHPRVDYPEEEEEPSAEEESAGVREGE
ncbi:MAG: HDIG domain-containing protein [Anaerolineales bacterium]